MTWLAVLFSLMAPGAGQVFAGKFVQGIIFGALYALGKSALLPLSLRVFKVTQLKRTLQFFYICNWGYIFLILYATVAAFFETRNVTETYFFATLFFIICVRLVQKQTFNKFIFTALCGRSGVWEIWQRLRKSSTEKK